MTGLERLLNPALGTRIWRPECLAAPNRRQFVCGASQSSSRSPSSCKLAGTISPRVTRLTSRFSKPAAESDVRGGSAARCQTSNARSLASFSEASASACAFRASAMTSWTLDSRITRLSGRSRLRSIICQNAHSPPPVATTAAGIAIKSSVVTRALQPTVERGAPAVSDAHPCARTAYRRRCSRIDGIAKNEPEFVHEAQVKERRRHSSKSRESHAIFASQP
jgi:hypothetical protein